MTGVLPTSEEWRVIVDQGDRQTAATPCTSRMPRATDAARDRGACGFFTGVYSDFYWSSTAYPTPLNPPTRPKAFHAVLGVGVVNAYAKDFYGYVWPVRNGP